MEEVLERTLSRCWCQVHTALLDVHFPTLLIIVLKQINWKTICSKHTVCHCILLSHQYCTPSEHMVQILHVENTNHPPLEKLSIFQLSVNRWCTVLLAFLLGAIFYQTPWVPFSICSNFGNELDCATRLSKNDKLLPSMLKCPHKQSVMIIMTCQDE
jgi:hypothetical protein